MKRGYGQKYLYLGKLMMARLGLEVLSRKTWRSEMVAAIWSFTEDALTHNYGTIRP